jgi:hypothetical protein
VHPCLAALVDRLVVNGAEEVALLDGLLDHAGSVWWDAVLRGDGHGDLDMRAAANDLSDLLESGGFGDEKRFRRRVVSLDFFEI